MDNHQGDGNSLRHRVASCSSHSEVLFGTIAPHWRRQGLFFTVSSWSYYCHTRNKVKTPAAIGGSNSAIWPEISINKHADYGKIHTFSSGLYYYSANTGRFKISGQRCCFERHSQLCCFHRGKYRSVHWQAPCRNDSKKWIGM